MKIFASAGTVLFTAVLLVVAPFARAEVVRWTNSNNGNWTITNNWSPNRAPSTNDVAVITNTGTYAVTLNVDPTIAGLFVGGRTGTQTVATAGHTLTLNGQGTVNTNGNILLSGGSLSGTNRITLAGSMTWQYGSIDTNASISVATGGRLTIASGGNHAKYLYGSLTNGGFINWQPLGSLNIGGTLHILAEGVFDAQVNGNSILKQSDAAVIINQGVFRKSTGDNINCYVPVVNWGSIDTQAGTLAFLDGSELHSGCAFAGAGVTRLNPGVHTLNGTICASNLMLNGATLEGHGEVSGSVIWNYGEIADTASLTVATNAVLTISSTANFTKFVYGNLTNAGTITWQPTGYLNISGTLHNLPGALFDAQVDNISILKSNNDSLIINDGVFRKSAGSYTVGCGVPIINSGTIEVFSGTLQFDGGFTNQIGTISLVGGTFRTTPPLFLAGGLLTGWGTVQTDVTNSACVRPASSNGVMSISGNYAQTLGGNTEFELAGNSPGANQSRLNVTGSATLRGTIGVRWANGYEPSPGTSFQVMTFQSHNGEFDIENGFVLLGRGRRLVPAYSSTSLILSTIAAPDPNEVPFKLAVSDGSALVAWPLEFTGYDLYCTTNLAQTNWTLIPGVANHFLETPPLAREKFFRLCRP